MRISSKKIISFCLTLLLALPAAVSAGDEDMIKYRQNVMKGNGAHIGAIAAIVKGQVDFSDQLVDHAQALNALSGMVGPAFAKRTEGGKTRAKPEIWTMSAEFKEKVGALEAAAADLLSAAQSGGLDAAKAKMGAVGDACKGCHEKFREKKS